MPLKLSIDGRPAEPFTFRFQKMPNFARVQGAQGRSLETVDISGLRDPVILDRFVAVMRSATSSIAVSYFDKSARFSTDPANASIANVDTQCGARTSAR